ncbi:MAG: type IV pilus twitching motility protein PilT [Planctomycetota bacterium]
MDERLRELMAQMKERNASDLHITVGVPPHYRIFGSLQPVDMPDVTPDTAREMIYSMLDDTQRERLEEERELDNSIGLEGIGRYRVNISFQRGNPTTAIRRLPYEIPEFSELGLPVDTMRDLCDKSRGMVLVTGPTGSGKSTTLASMIDYINNEFSRHVICVEDPIEYLHNHKTSIVNQRELGQDTLSFPKALKYVLRQDPDVVQIGEMRDLETIRSMLTVAETGHLAFSTLHTNTAAGTINRIIDVFPPEQQEQIRVQLSFVLSAVISQQLLPRTQGDGLALACEILVATPAVRSLIREGSVDQIYSQIQMGKGIGMKTMNESLAELTLSGDITEEAARAKSSDVKELDRMLRGVGESTNA